MKKIISIILVATLCMNSIGGAGLTLAQNYNGMESNLDDDLDKKEESVEDSSFDEESKVEEENLGSDKETEKEENEVETEEETEKETEKEEDEVETEESSSESESETQKETEESKTRDEETVESVTADDLNKEESTSETVLESIEETSESDDDAKVASLSEAEYIQDKNELYGWEDYTGKNFYVYLDLSRTYDGKTLPESIFSRLYQDRITLVSDYPDMYGQFSNSGNTNQDLILNYYNWRDALGSDKFGTAYRTDGETFERVYRVVNDRFGQDMYYIDRIQRDESVSSSEQGIKLYEEGTEVYFSKEMFTKGKTEWGEDCYELVLYPSEYKPLLIGSWTYRFIDPDTGYTYGTYTDSLNNYNSLYEGEHAFNGGNFAYSDCSLQVDLPVYSDDVGGAFTYKTWEDISFTASKNYGKTRKFHKAFQTLDCYDQELDADVNNSNPYTFSYKLVPEESDIYELPLTEEQQATKDAYPNYAPRAQVTRIDPTFTFEVYKMGDVKYYNNDGTVQIDNVWVGSHTQITNGKWPNSFPSPGLKYIQGFYVRGWNREPGKDRNADETSFLVGQAILDDDAKMKGLKLYAVGDVAETFTVNYDVNMPPGASSTWTVDRERDKDLYTHDGNNTTYFMHSNPEPTATTDVRFWANSAVIKDVDDNIILKLKGSEEFIAEDGNIYYSGQAYKQGLDTKEKWVEAFGDDKEMTVKYNWEPKSTNIKYKFKLKGTTNDDYLGNEWVSGDGVKILDDVSDKLENDYLINIYKTKNGDYNSALDSYINYVIDKVEYPENTIENDKLVRLEAEVTVYIAKKVRFTYYDAKGNDITTKIEELAVTDGLAYVENDFGAYPVNPLNKTANTALGAIIPNKKVTGWKTSPTAAGTFSSFNSDWSMTNAYYRTKVDTRGTKFYAVEKGSYTVKFETVANMSYVWPSNVDKSTQLNVETNANFTLPTVKGDPDNKYYHDGWTLNGTDITINEARIKSDMEALVNASNELIFKPVIKLLSSTGTLTLEVDSTKATVNGYTEFINKDNFNSKKSSVTLNVIGTNVFKHWQLKGTSSKYNTVADFNWDGNDATLVAVFKGDSGVSIVVDSTKATYTGKADYDDQTEFNTDKSNIGSKISPLPTWKFTGFKESTTGIQYKTDLSDFTWDGNDSVELVAEFELIIKHLTFEIDSTKATTTAKLTYDTSEVGSIVVPTMTVNTAYEFVRWVKKGTTTEVNPTTWNGVDDLTVVAEFRVLKTLKFDVSSSDIQSVTGATEFNEKSTSITIPTIVCKSGRKIAGWIINGNTSDVKTTSQLQTAINAWSKTSDMLIAPTFTNLKTFVYYVDNNYLETPINPSDLEYDEDNMPPTTLPTIIPKRGYNKAGDNGGWSTKQNGTKSDILSNTDLQNIINDFRTKPSDQKQNVKLYYVFVEDDTITKVKLNYDRAKGRLDGGPDVYIDVTDFDNTKLNVSIIPNSNYTFDGWKDSNTGATYKTLSEVNWDGSISITLNAMFTAKVNNNPNNGGGNSSGGSSSGGSSSGGSDSNPTTPPAGFIPNNPVNPSNPLDPNQPVDPNQPFGPNKPVDPNQPNNVPPVQTEEERKERQDNPPADKYLIVNLDSNSSSDYSSVEVFNSGDSVNYYNWETSDKVVWRLIDMRYLEENVHYNKTNEKSVVKSLNRPEINYYEDGWVLLDYKNTREWYHFGNDGIMNTGWFEQGGRFYYLQTDYNTTYGKMLVGEYNIGGVTCVFGKNGVLEEIKP